MSFSRFAELPFELRAQIWEETIPGPRVIEFRLEKLKKRPDRDFHTFPNFYTGPTNTLNFLPGLKSTTQSQELAPMLACKEAFDVFSKRYTKFGSAFGIPETYFDLERDVFFLNYMTFMQCLWSFSEGGLPVYGQFRRLYGDERCIITGLRTLNLDHELAKVKNLALVDVYPSRHKAGFAHSSTCNEIADLLSIFTRLKTLSLVVDHYKLSTEDTSAISLIEALNTRELLNGYQVYMRRPGNKLDGILRSSTVSMWNEDPIRPYLIPQLWTSMQRRTRPGRAIQIKEPRLPEIYLKNSMTEGLRTASESVWAQMWKEKLGFEANFSMSHEEERSPTSSRVISWEEFRKQAEILFIQRTRGESKTKPNMIG